MMRVCIHAVPTLYALMFLQELQFTGGKGVFVVIWRCVTVLVRYFPLELKFDIWEKRSRTGA